MYLFVIRIVKSRKSVWYDTSPCSIRILYDVLSDERKILLFQGDSRMFCYDDSIYKVIRVVQGDRINVAISNPVKKTGREY